MKTGERESCTSEILDEILRVSIDDGVFGGKNLPRGEV